MASTLRWAVMVVGVSAALLLTAGCQPNHKTASARFLPPPSFDGPRINRAASQRPGVAVAPSGPAAWKPVAPPRAWRWIVIHHSASAAGSMSSFDKEHRAKGWDGVGYHFVIGNGSASGDGQIELTARWPAQKWGAHAKTVDNRFNEYGIGICLVGNFDAARPSAKQMESLSKLVAHLMQTYRIPATNVVGHRDTKPTECPGRNLDIAAVRHLAARGLASGAAIRGERAQLAGVELLQPGNGN